MVPWICKRREQEAQTMTDKEILMSAYEIEMEARNNPEEGELREYKRLLELRAEEERRLKEE